MDKFNANESVDTARLEKLFLESGTLKILRKNEYMVRQNDKTNHIGFVTSGIFRLTRIDTNGNEWIVGCSFISYKVGAGFSYEIGKYAIIKSQTNYQYNIIQKRWEWFFGTGVSFTF